MFQSDFCELLIMQNSLHRDWCSEFFKKDTYILFLDSTIHFDILKVLISSTVKKLIKHHLIKHCLNLFLNKTLLKLIYHLECSIHQIDY